MKHLIATLLACMLTISMSGQVQILTKKEKLSDFPTKTTKVVLSGNAIIDQALKEAVRNSWAISPYEFCDVDEFNALKNNKDYYFMVIVKTQYKHETAPGISMLTIAKGSDGAKDVDDMLEVASLPLCPAAAPSGRESAMFPAIIDIVQGYISKSLLSGFSGISSYTSKLTKSAGKKIIIPNESISAQVSQATKDKLSGKLVFMSDIEADEVFISGEKNTLVGYVIAPEEPSKGSVCYKLLLDAKTHELYYFKKSSVSKAGEAGFDKGDLSKMASCARADKPSK